MLIEADAIEAGSASAIDNSHAGIPSGRFFIMFFAYWLNVVNGSPYVLYRVWVGGIVLSSKFIITFA